MEKLRDTPMLLARLGAEECYSGCLVADGGAMFWGSELLREKLPNIVTDYDEKRVDEAAYRLRIGAEVFVSPTGRPTDPVNGAKKQLKDGEGFTIPAGQFGLILTEETVTVPPNALGFISVRTSVKFQGLVNVSGFHVDPSYEGKLVFSVFNAGPGSVHLARGEECFLIWFASLDRHQAKKKLGHSSLESKLIKPILGQVQSIAGLDGKIDEEVGVLKERFATLEKEQAVIKWASALLLGALLTLLVRSCSVEMRDTSTTHSPHLVLSEDAHD